MQDYITFAEKNGVLLQDKGSCQLCGARTTRGVHECVEIFSLGFSLIDYGLQANYRYRFLSVDAHTLQHPEIHGRWNNHFHLTRKHLMLHYGMRWDYKLSPKLSDFLNAYKASRPEERLDPPPVLQRGSLTTVDISQQAQTAEQCKSLVKEWSQQVYEAWRAHHSTVDVIAKTFLGEL